MDARELTEEEKEQKRIEQLYLEKESLAKLTKDFASAFYHHLLCTLNDHHRVLWMAALSYHFRVARAEHPKALADNNILETILRSHCSRIATPHTAKRILASIINNTLLSQTLATLTNTFKYNTSLPPLPSSHSLPSTYEDLIAPLQDYITPPLSQATSIARLTASIKRKIKKWASRARRHLSRMPSMNFSNGFTSQESYRGKHTSHLPFLHETIHEDYEGSPREDEDERKGSFSSTVKYLVPAPLDTSLSEDA